MERIKNCHFKYSGLKVAVNMSAYDKFPNKKNGFKLVE